MTQKTDQSSSTKHIYSNDSDSDESSSGCFVALPQEFRPNLIPQSKRRTKDFSYNTKQSKHNSNSSASKCCYTTADSKSAEKQKKTMYPRQNTFKKYPVNDESAENKNITKCEQTASANTCQNSAREIDDNRNIRTKTNSTPVLNTERTSKIGSSFIYHDANEETSLANNSLLFKNQCALQSKAAKNRTEQVEKSEPRTIKINFEMPLTNFSQTEKIEYTAKFSSEIEPITGILKGENPVVRPSKTKGNYYKATDKKTLNFRQNSVQWDDKLGQDKQKNSVKSKIQWQITEGKNVNGMAGNKFNNNTNNDSKSKQAHNIQTFLKEISHGENSDTSFQANYIREMTVKNPNQSKSKNPNQSKSSLQEKVYQDVISFYNNNFRENTLNHVGTQERNANHESSMQSIIKKKNELDTKSPCHASSHSMQNLHFDCKNGIDSRPPNFNHTIEEKPDNKSLECKPNSNSFNSSEVKNLREKDIFYYGKEMSDLIIGSHDTLSIFVAIYKEWIISRQELIDFLEQLQKNLKDSSKKFTKYQDIVKYAGTGVKIVSAIPHPYAVLAARIVSLFTTLFSNFLDKPKNAGTDNSNEITSLLFKDTRASMDLYMYGLQCNQQFEETVKIIEEFHSKVKNFEILPPPTSGEIAIFVQDIIEYKPTHKVFYKKLHKCFQELLHVAATKSGSQRFCEPFFLYSSTAVDVIGFLNWRFRSEDFNNESVRYELEQIHTLITNSNTTSLENLIAQLENCLRIMKEQLIFIKKCLEEVSLFDNASEQFVKKL